MRKPKLFIASSVESLSVAEAVNVNLDHEFEVTIWKNGTFKLSSTAIEDLVEKSSTVDFALFIFTPDDIATIRSRKEHVVRDNVVFEMGLFVGAIGKSRSFYLKPRDTEMHLPTDLLGVTAADYDANRSDGDLVSATNRACALIKAEVDKIGLINFAAIAPNQVIRANPKNYEMVQEDARVLAACLQSYINLPEGLSFDRISTNLRKIEDHIIQLSLIKLERMDYVTKSVETNHEYGFDYYAYKITEAGIDFLLSSKLITSVPPASEQPVGFGAFDEDIPF